MLSGNCTEALSIQANVSISCSSAKLIKNGIAPLPFPLPALLQPYGYIKRGERVRVRGHAQFYAMLGTTMHRYTDKTTAVSRGGWTDGLIQHVHHVKPVLGCARRVVRPRGGRISRGNVVTQVSQGICQVVHEADPIDFPRHTR